MNRNYILIFLTVLIISSCGKSKAEIELEKTKIELAKKTKKEEQLKLDKIHEQKVNVGKRRKITELNLMLQKITEEKKKANENLQNVHKFQIGRSTSTKEKQLKKAREKITEIYKYGEKIKNEIAQLEYHKTFDFQKDPESVMKYIFDSAKKGDFSNFRNLCDPYGENDADVNQICYAEMMLKKQQTQLKAEFENGRVIGKAKINGDKAEVEFAYGPSSNRLEKMKMINRNGLWYLGAF